MKCGSCSTLEEFRRPVGAIVEEYQAHHHIPDYSVELDGEDMVVFRNRGTIPDAIGSDPQRMTMPSPSAEGYNDARTVVPSWDAYYLEREWREWITEPPRDVDAAFVGFCRKWYETRGGPK